MIASILLVVAVIVLFYLDYRYIVKRHSPEVMDAHIRRNRHYAVDFDGTLCEDGCYEMGQDPTPRFDPLAEITGQPVQATVDLINRLRTEGHDVRILTARNVHGPVHAWLKKHLGYDLEVSNVKGHGIIAFYDDRAVRVERNTGRRCKCFGHPFHYED